MSIYLCGSFEMFDDFIFGNTRLASVFGPGVFQRHFSENPIGALGVSWNREISHDYCHFSSLRGHVYCLLNIPKHLCRALAKEIIYVAATIVSIAKTILLSLAFIFPLKASSKIQVKEEALRAGMRFLSCITSACGELFATGRAVAGVLHPKAYYREDRVLSAVPERSAELRAVELTEEGLTTVLTPSDLLFGNPLERVIDAVAEGLKDRVGLTNNDFCSIRTLAIRILRYEFGENQSQLTELNKLRYWDDFFAQAFLQLSGVRYPQPGYTLREVLPQQNEAAEKNLKEIVQMTMAANIDQWEKRAVLDTLVGRSKQEGYTDFLKYGCDRIGFIALRLRLNPVVYNQEKLFLQLEGLRKEREQKHEESERKQQGSQEYLEARIKLETLLVGLPSFEYIKQQTIISTLFRDISNTSSAEILTRLRILTSPFGKKAIELGYDPFTEVDLLKHLADSTKSGNEDLCKEGAEYIKKIIDGFSQFERAAQRTILGVICNDYKQMSASDVLAFLKLQAELHKQIQEQIGQRKES